MIGETNVAACSSMSLSSPFGLESILGKSVAIMSDFRAGSDMAVTLDRLLRIVGGDPVEVNRKNRRMLSSVKMWTRFVLVSNELPDIKDACKAITGRYHILRTTKTVPAELPGILNLAIEGRKRLHQRGRSNQPASGMDLIEDAEDMASPVAECVKESFVVGLDYTVHKAEAFETWTRWAEEHGHKVGDSGTFGRNLLAAFPALKSTRPRDCGKPMT